MVGKESNTGMLTPDKKEIKYYTLTNSSGAKVVLSNLGAGIVSIEVPDSKGNMDNVVLGYEKAGDYYSDPLCMGKIPGRYANRIAFGRFSIGDKSYQLPVNNGIHHLHGGDGECCFANRIWNTFPSSEGVSFALYSQDGDAGYPGNLMVEALYGLGEDNKLVLKIRAKSDKETIINLTNHVYFDLRGASAAIGDKEGCGIRNHILKLYASRYLPVDETLIPTGELLSVKGTQMDFSESLPLGNYSRGYDNCWALDNYNPDTVKRAAELSDPVSGRKVVIRTNQPGIQVYTIGDISGSPKGKNGREYVEYDGVAIECQAFPDSPNKKHFPFKPLGCGEIYENIIEWKFM